MSDWLDCSATLKKSGFGNKYSKPARLPLSKKNLKKLNLRWIDVAKGGYRVLARSIYKKELDGLSSQSGEKMLNDYTAALYCLNQGVDPEQAGINIASFAVEYVACRYLSVGPISYCTHGEINYRLAQESKKVVKKRPQVIPQKTKIVKKPKPLKKKVPVKKPDIGVASVMQVNIPKGKVSLLSESIDFVIKSGIDLTTIDNISVISSSGGLKIRESGRVQENPSEGGFTVFFDPESVVSGETYNLNIKINYTDEGINKETIVSTRVFIPK